jgi:hypothetical protein
MNAKMETKRLALAVWSWVGFLLTVGAAPETLVITPARLIY